jgi:hypothetical protein
MDAAAPKVTSNIHAGSSYQATYRKYRSHTEWIFSALSKHNVTMTEERCKKFAVKEMFNKVKATLNIIHKMCWKINTSTGTRAQK